MMNSQDSPAPPAEPHSPPVQPARRGPFGLTGWILSTVVTLALVAMILAMWPAFGLNQPPRGILVLLPVLAPVVLMMALGLFYTATQAIRHLMRRRRLRD